MATINGNNFLNVLLGTLDDDQIYGFGGADVLTGLAGNDYLDGGEGADVMVGGTGNDTYVVDNELDVVTELLGGGIDTVNSYIDYSLGNFSFIENLTLLGQAVTGTGNDDNNVITGNDVANVLYGLEGNDTLFGGRGNDQLFGGIGNDKLNGGIGADVMTGGTGNDNYIVDNAKDKVIEAAGEGRDVVTSTVSYALDAHQSIEVLQLAPSTGTKNLSLTGNNLANSLRGNDGSNVLDGGGGADVLFGGGGADTFAFSSELKPGNVGHIMDFVAGVDRIRLDQSEFNQLDLGKLSASEFKVLGQPGARVDADDHILYNKNNGGLYYDPDGSGAAKAVLFATLDNKPQTISADDFFVVA